MINYRIHKTSFGVEKYLIKLSSKYLKYFCKFRTCNTKLPVEIGRWQNLPRKDRTCKLCLRNDIGDEFHYLFNCDDTCIMQSRMTFMPRYFYLHPNVFKFEQLFNTKNTTLLTKLCKFIKTIIERVSSPG